MIVIIDFSSSYESLLQRVALYRLLNATSSSGDQAPPLLGDDCLPLLKSFYLDGLNIICKRLKAWIEDTKVTEHSISIEIVECGREATSSVVLQTMISDTLKIVLEYYVLSVLYADYNGKLSEQFAKQSEDMLNSLIEIFAII